MDQTSLFEAHIYDALDNLVAQLGRPKEVAHALWPEKGIDTAAKDLRNMLNPDHRAKFDLFDVVRLLKMGQEAGCHVGMDRLCSDAGYKRPEPINTEEQKAEIDKKLSAMLEKVADLMSVREDLNNSATNVATIDR